MDKVLHVKQDEWPTGATKTKARQKTKRARQKAKRQLGKKIIKEDF